MEKRIDLTQFEGITKGPWEFPLLSGTLVTAYPHPTIVKYEDEEADCRLRLGKINCPYDGRAIAKLPDLIAELKRCYAKFDKLQKLVTWQHEVSDSIKTDDDLLVILTRELS